MTKEICPVHQNDATTAPIAGHSGVGQSSNLNNCGFIVAIGFSKYSADKKESPLPHLPASGFSLPLLALSLYITPPFGSTMQSTETSRRGSSGLAEQVGSLSEDELLDMLEDVPVPSAPPDGALPTRLSPAPALGPLQLELTQTFSQRTKKHGNVISVLKKFRVNAHQFRADASGNHHMSPEPIGYHLTLLCGQTPVGQLSLRGSSSSPPQSFTKESVTSFEVVSGRKEVELQIERAITSYNYREHRPAGAREPSFRILVQPSDQAVAAANPGLVVMTHEFKVVTKLHPPKDALMLEEPPVSLSATPALSSPPLVVATVPSQTVMATVVATAVVGVAAAAPAAASAAAVASAAAAAAAAAAAEAAAAAAASAAAATEPTDEPSPKRRAMTSPTGELSVSPVPTGATSAEPPTSMHVTDEKIHNLMKINELEARNMELLQELEQLKQSKAQQQHKVQEPLTKKEQQEQQDDDELFGLFTSGCSFSAERSVS